MVTCSSCNAEVVPGTRWCNICHTNVVNPSLGKLASPGKRLGAFVLDLVIPVTALFLMIAVAGIGGATETEAGAGLGGIIGLLVFLAYIIWALVLFARGTTPGKKVLGMRVIKEDGTPAGFMTMLLREWIGKWISGLILLLGFLWILFDKDNQGWHDKLMSTYVTA